MEALGCIELPYTRKVIIRSSRSAGIKLASQGRASPCLIPCRKEGLLKASATLRMILPKERKKDCVLQCKSHAEETKAHTGNFDDSENMVQRKRLAVFVSGGGSNFRAIYEATMVDIINANVTVLVTDKPGCGGASFARDNQIPVLIFPNSKSAPDGLSPVDLIANLRKYEVDYILLAGYLKLIPVELVRAYPKSILNIHPSLLPAFGGKGYYGLKVHQAVIASGARYSGPTIHFVDEQYDTGRILSQKVVPVLANDTPEKLAARVLEQEHHLYVEVVSALCENRISWREDGVPLIRSKDDPNKLY